MNSKSRLKIGFVVGDLPTTTFINRLAIGLVNAGADITMYGLIKNRFDAPKGVKISGSKDGYKEGRNGKLIRFLKFGTLLRLFKPKQKKILDSWLQQAKKTHWHEKSLLYPILWDSPQILHVQWAKAIKHFGWADKVGIKLVLSLRGAHINYSPLTVPGLAESYRKTFPLVNGFHGVSKAICAEAVKYGAELNKCHVVYSGFDLSKIKVPDLTGSHESQNTGRINIISVGRAHWKKGYHFSLDAMKLLKQQQIPFKYTIIGAKGDEELEFQRAQLNILDEVTFLDKVSFEEVKKLITQADVLLLPSVEEGIANVVLEAMLLRTLVVTTDCGGMAEVITNGENGFIIPVRNPKAIAEALKKVVGLAPSSIEAMIQQAFEKVSEQHSEERMVRGMLDLYSKVLSATVE